METAAVLKNAGGQNYKSFVLGNKESITTTETTQLCSDKKVTIDQTMLTLDVQNDQVGDNQTIPVNSKVEQIESQLESEHQKVKPSSPKIHIDELTDQPMDDDKNKTITSQPVDATATEFEATKDQASEIEIAQEIDFQIDTKADLSYGKQLPSKPSKVKSNSSLFAKAISFLKGEKKSSIVSSCIALYGAQATILAGSIIGSPLGKKAMEIGEKVAKNAAEDLKEKASHLPQTLPALLWTESTSPTPLITPTPTATPSPEPVKVPSPVVVNIDPIEKRIRKARAQLDEKKTPAFLAIQELLKVHWL